MQKRGRGPGGVGGERGAGQRGIESRRDGDRLGPIGAAESLPHVQLTGLERALHRRERRGVERTRVERSEEAADEMSDATHGPSVM